MEARNGHCSREIEGRMERGEKRAPARRGAVKTPAKGEETPFDPLAPSVAPTAAARRGSGARESARSGAISGSQARL